MVTFQHITKLKTTVSSKRAHKQEKMTILTCSCVRSSIISWKLLEAVPHVGCSPSALCAAFFAPFMWTLEVEVGIEPNCMWKLVGRNIGLWGLIYNAVFFFHLS